MTNKTWPAIVVPPEYDQHAGSYRKGRLAGRADESALPRSWFMSEGAYEAYIAGWKKGNEECQESKST